MYQIVNKMPKNIVVIILARIIVVLKKFVLYLN